MSDKNHVLNKWKQEFDILYNKPVDTGGIFDEQFYNWAKAEKSYLETQPSPEPDLSLNNDFTKQEMEQACNSLKLRKAVGVDLNPNEVLKQPALQEIMLNFMNSCFSYHTIQRKFDLNLSGK